MELRVRVAGGKTLALDVECRGKEVVGLRIHGDFFFHPEEGLEDLENFLLKERLWEHEDPAAVIRELMWRKGYKASGFGPDDLASLLRGVRC